MVRPEAIGGYAVDDFAFDLRRSVAPANHLWVGSGYATVAPRDRTVMGVRGLHSPPFTAPDLELEIEIEADGHRILDQGSLGKGDVGVLLSGSTWFPDRIERTGTYHHIHDEELLSLTVTTRLAPLTGHHGFVLAVVVTNRSGRAMSITMSASATPGAPGRVDLSEWDYGWPRYVGAPATELGSGGAWENEHARVTLLAPTGGHAALEAGGEIVRHFGVVLTPSGSATAMKHRDLPGEILRTARGWEHRVSDATRRLPVLSSDVPGLEEYYRRSLVSGLICLWENAEFAVQPFPTVSGIEGAGVCCYPWDIGGYAARTVALMLGADVTMDLLRVMVESGIEQHSRFSPNGTGNDVPYAYSVWSFVNLAWAAGAVHRPHSNLLAASASLLDAESRRVSDWQGLIDYGPQHELLEMRGAGYEHVVASPNAERAWVMDRLAELATLLDETDRYPVDSWRREAQLIRERIKTLLWDEDAGWFKAVYPNGHEEIIFSIQYFDALRFGACTPAMTEALVSHVRDGAFLGEYGVSSVSAEDVAHYELNDPDWSGSGAYTGDGPMLALTLWEQGRAESAWDVLRRHLWMGHLLPYFPQEHYADRPVIPEHKRANVIAGLSGVEAILFGMLGIDARPDGSLVIAPHPAPGEVLIRGLEIRGHVIDVRLRPDSLVIWLDGDICHDGEIRAVTVLAP